MGPTLIFDKSFLQAINPDEAALLEHFFVANLTPVFFMETVADLEKESRAGRTAESVVGSLAYKTPALNAFPNVHHVTLLAGELLGAQPIDLLCARPVVAAPRPIHVGTRVAVSMNQTPEAAAFQRWQQGEFIELDRTFARAWRESLAQFQEAFVSDIFREHVAASRPATLAHARARAYSFVEIIDPEELLRLGTTLAQLSISDADRAVTRWREAGRPEIRRFAPYLHHLLQVNAFFQLSVAASLIDGARASNWIDISYLYYLPFCKAFVSSDRLHARTVPLFVGSHQAFVSGDELKAGLAHIDDHYSKLPLDVTETGLTNFAPHPPIDGEFFVTSLWDRFIPGWRERILSLGSSATTASDESVRREFSALRQAASTGAPPYADTEPDFVAIERHVLQRKGKWRAFPAPSSARQADTRGA